MTDSCKYRFLLYILKTKLILQNFSRKCEQNNIFILANLCQKLHGRGIKELPIKPA